MAKLYQNISTLVFRRNIPFKLETYIVNCEMLQVLAELDGIKNVSVVAAKLNRKVPDLVTTFAALYQQKLILLVKPNPAVVSTPPPKITIRNDIKEIDRKNLNPSSSLKQNHRPAKQPVRRNQIGQKVFRSPRVLKKLPSAPALNYSAHRNRDKSDNKKHHVPPKEVFELDRNVDGKKQDPGSGIFRINKPKQSDLHQVDDKSLSSGQPSTFTINRDGSDLPEFDHLEVNMDAGFSNQKAIKYFEIGLALLKQRSYKAALTQFEKSLGLNPQNRLCRANIQRIRKILEAERT
jgi:hypothetical protein